VRRIAALAAVGVAAVAARRIAGFGRSLSSVAPELRTAAIIPMSVPFTTLTLPAIRLAYSYRSDPGPGVDMTEHRVGPVEVLVLTPTPGSAPRPAVLTLHGGAMCVGTAQLEAEPAARIARELGAVMVMPNYRLAPEHPFPAPLDDCMATLHWMREHAEDLGIDVDRIAVFGPSAGGGLSAAVAQRALDEGIALRVQAMIYPMLDDRTVLRDDHCGRGELVWSPESNRFAWTAYLGREPRMSNAPEYAAPARRVDLSGLPPAWIGIGDLDLFYDECVDYAERLTAAGVPCELVTVPGMYHTADGLRRNAPTVRKFYAAMDEFLRTHL
jgi:acetyl esterase/lipase